MTTPLAAATFQLHKGHRLMRWFTPLLKYDTGLVFLRLRLVTALVSDLLTRSINKLRPRLPLDRRECLLGGVCVGVCVGM